MSLNNPRMNIWQYNLHDLYLAEVAFIKYAKATRFLGLRVWCLETKEASVCFLLVQLIHRINI
jgi:hypothetical protein